MLKIMFQFFLVTMFAAFLIPISLKAQESPSSQSQAEFQKITSIIAEVKKTAVRDEKGTVKEVSLSNLGDGKHTLRFDYDNNSRLSSITDEKGKRTLLSYDENNRFKYYEFSNGTQLHAVYAKSQQGVGILVGLKWKHPNGEFEKIRMTTKSSYGDVSDRDCREAIDAAGAAAVIAIAVCGVDPYSGDCVAATGTAAYLAYRAWRICYPSAEEEL